MQMTDCADSNFGVWHDGTAHSNAIIPRKKNNFEMDIVDLSTLA